MAIFDIFSKRQKIIRGEVPDVYVYDVINEKLRVQIVHIIRDALGEDNYGSEHARNAYNLINDILCREYGLFELTRHPNNKADSVLNFLLTTSDYEQALDVIELSFRVIDRLARENEYTYYVTRKISPDDAITELNQRFQASGAGYRYEGGILLRIDSELTHTEIIKPALQLLRNAMYAGANEEFIKAHEHFRHGRLKESINEALKSFESTMKAICTKHKWAFKPTDTAKTLIDVCLSNELIPTYMQSQVSSLRSLLESGIPTVRNKVGGHGQGAEIQPTTIGLTQYALNLAASNIILFAQHECEL
jgi:hypothetical protein